MRASSISTWPHPRLALTLERAKQMIDTPRRLSQHPAGFLTRDRLEDLVPIEPAAMKDRRKKPVEATAIMERQSPGGDHWSPIRIGPAKDPIGRTIRRIWCKIAYGETGTLGDVSTLSDLTGDDLMIKRIAPHAQAG